MGKIGRNIEFDKEYALNQAMYLFWSKGYDATPISELIETMGISRSTLYTSFGDKDELFKQVLAQYKKRGLKKRALLHSGETVKESLRAFFKQHIEKCYEEAVPKSCIITNSSLLIGHVDPTIEKILLADFNELERVFNEVIEKGRASGEFSQVTQVELATYSLVALNHSINIMSAYKKEKELAYELVEKAIEKL